MQGYIFQAGYSLQPSLHKCPPSSQIDEGHIFVYINISNDTPLLKVASTLC